jgi:hypothetical protein
MVAIRPLRRVASRNDDKNLPKEGCTMAVTIRALEELVGQLQLAEQVEVVPTLVIGLGAAALGRRGG